MTFGLEFKSTTDKRLECATVLPKLAISGQFLAILKEQSLVTLQLETHISNYLPNFWGPEFICCGWWLMWFWFDWTGDWLVPFIDGATGFALNPLADWLCLTSQWESS